MSQEITSPSDTKAIPFVIHNPATNWSSQRLQTRKGCPIHLIGTTIYDNKESAGYEALYVSGKPLGSGTYGMVSLVESKVTGKKYAVKNIKMSTDAKDIDGIPSTALREIAILRELRNHPNIVKLVDVLVTKNITYLIFEYMLCDLLVFLENFEKQNLEFTENTRKRFMKDFLLGLAYMHEKKILHRDLKPQNLLISHTDHRLKIADFGLARFTTAQVDKYSNDVITLWYRPPELILGSTMYDSSVDIWCAGCIMIEMYLRKLPWKGTTPVDLLLKILQLLGPPNSDSKRTVWLDITKMPLYSTMVRPHLKTINTYKFSLDIVLKGIMDDSGLDLLLQLLHYTPSNRITAVEALKHPYFDSITD